MEHTSKKADTKVNHANTGTHPFIAVNFRKSSRSLPYFEAFQLITITLPAVSRSQGKSPSYHNSFVVFCTNKPSSLVYTLSFHRGPMPSCTASDRMPQSKPPIPRVLPPLSDGESAKLPVPIFLIIRVSLDFLIDRPSPRNK
jgi:hypothetical protein